MTGNSVLAGGPTFNYVLKSKVVKLDLAADLLATQTQLIEVRLASINLKDVIADLPGMLPSSVMALNLGNTLLSSFPSHLEVLANLEELYAALLLMYAQLVCVCGADAGVTCTCGLGTSTRTTSRV